MVPIEPRNLGPKLSDSLVNTPAELTGRSPSEAERNRPVWHPTGPRIRYNVRIGTVSRAPSSRTCRNADVRPNRWAPRKEVACESHFDLLPNTP